MLVGENKLLRELLVKLAERAKEDQKMLSFLRQAAASGGRAQEYELEYNKIFAKEQVPRGTDRAISQIALANRVLFQHQHGVLEEVERAGERNVSGGEGARLHSYPTVESKDRAAGVLRRVP